MKGSGLPAFLPQAPEPFPVSFPEVFQEISFFRSSVLLLFLFPVFSRFCLFACSVYDYSSSKAMLFSSRRISACSFSSTCSEGSSSFFLEGNQGYHL